MFPSDTELDTKFTFETESNPIDEELPFQLLLMGDWSGSGSRSDGLSSASDRPIEIDRDNFDDVIRKLQVKVNLDFFGNEENSILIGFNELDDFHPDKIFQTLPLFANLREVRRRLVNPNTFNAAAAEVRSWFEDQETLGVKDSVSTNTEDALTTSPNLLDQILGQSNEPITVSDSQSNTSSELRSFINQLVKPHIVRTDTDEQSKLLIIIDEVISDLMRKILHHPNFQALESAWRSAFLLVRKLETNSTLKVFILDVSKSNLIANLKSVNDLTETNLFKTLTRTENPFALVCGAYTFGLNVEDIAVLIRLAKIGSNFNTPFISHIEPEMFGFKSFDLVSNVDNWKVADDSTQSKLWNALRSLPESAYLGLSLPRFLIRLPFGEKTEPTETFYFEEFIQNDEHDNFLWGNPGFICSLLLAQSFQAAGWNLRESLIQDFDGLPAYSYKDETETKTKPCAEVSLTQTNCEKLISQGLMPLVSFRDTNRLRVARFQSVEFSESMLSGRWNHS